MIYLFIDESGDGFHSDGIAILCCIVLYDPAGVSSKINILKSDILHDGRLNEILGDFCERGFHYTNDHFEIKNKFIELLKTLTFQAYICFDPKVTSGDFNSIYDRLFGCLIINRLREHRKEKIDICFEQHGNPEKRQKELCLIIESKIKEINTSDRSKFDGSFVLRCAGKEEPCLSIVDYICGIFREYNEFLLESKMTGKEDLRKRNFEDLRLKIRYIHDVKNNKFYSRRNPFP